MEWFALLADDPVQTGTNWSVIINSIITILTAAGIIIKQFMDRSQAAAAEAKAAKAVEEDIRVAAASAQRSMEVKQAAAAAAQSAAEAKQAATAAAVQTKAAIAENTALTKQAVAKVDVVIDAVKGA